MKKFVIMSFLFVMLAGCNTKTESVYMYWDEETDVQIQRLDEAGVRYEVKDGEILVLEEDMLKAVECCSYAHGYEE